MINDYIKTNWQNDPSTNTPLSAANLNHMEEGIAQNNADIKTLDGKITTITTDYEALDNKPQINNVVLVGNKTSNDLNIQGKLTAGANITIENDVISSSDSYDDSELRAEISAQERKIRLLEEAAMGKLYTQETNTSYSNDVSVPSGALSLATLDMLGGMSRKGKNLINISQTVTGYHLPSSLPSGTYTLSVDDESEPIGFRMSKTADTSHDSISSGTSFILNGRRYITLTTTFETNYINVSKSSFPLGANLPNLMLENGNTPTTYEPYTPNLIDGKVDDVVSYGKNLFDEELLLSNIPKSYKVDGTYHFILNDSISKLIPIALEPSTYSFTLKAKKQTDLTQSGRGLVLTKVYEDGTIDDVLEFMNNEAISEYLTKTTTMVLDKKISNIAFSYGSGGAQEYSINLSISKGTNGSYVPYREPKHYPIPSSVQALPNYGIGVNNNVYNYLEYADGKVLYHERVGSVDLGTLNYMLTQENYPRFAFDITDGAKISSSAIVMNMLCSRYPSVSATNQYVSGTFGIAKQGGESTKFYIRDSAYTNATTFKSAMNGVMLHYEKATETITDVTDLFPLNFNELEVEANGHINFHYGNDYKVDIPNTISYLIDLKGALNG